ncbi:MAG: GxxExxY protein [Nitrospiria bacterium]
MAANEFIHKELSYEVLGCAFEAFKTVGVGFSEIIYHKVFHENLTQRGLDARYKVRAHLDYRSKRVAQFEIDEIVEDKLVVELKDLQIGFIPENYAQVIAYLKLANLRLGLLINFGLHRAFPKRVIFDARRDNDEESWDKGFFRNFSKKSIVDAVVASIRNVDKEIGAGYHSKIYKTALGIELEQNHISYHDKVQINFAIKNIQLNPFEIDLWLVEDSILLNVLAGKDKPKLHDLLRTRSYLRHLNLHQGLIVYWSITNLQLYGIYEP